MNRWHPRVFLGFWALVAAWAQTRPVQLADYYTLESVSGTALSPDGRGVAYVRSHIIEAENRRHSEIWVDGERVSEAGANATGPRWSPDGKLLAYTTLRPAATWVVKMTEAGRPVEKLAGVEGAPVFSPDNRWIAFTRKTPPKEKRANQELTEFERLTEQRFKGRIYDWMNYRFDGRGYLPDPRDPNATPPSELYVIPREGGEARQLTRLGVDVQGVSWRADGKALVFVANTHQRDEYTYERSDLFTVTLEGTVRRLTDDGYHHQSPAWSPDGRSIAVLREQGLNLVLAAKQRHGSPLDVYLFPAEGGVGENLTADWDQLPGAPRWSKDGKSIFFAAGVGGTSHLYRLGVADHKVGAVTQGDRALGDISMADGGGVLAYTATSADHPVEVFTARGDGSGEKQVTAVNEGLRARWRLGKTERFRYDSRDGTSIDGWAVLPPGYEAGRKYPLIVDIHGGPHGAYTSGFAFPQQLLAAAGYIVIYTNPRASTGYGEKFRWGTWGGWGERDFEDVMAGVDYAIRHYGVDETRLGVTGYSYGGFLTNWIIGHTNRFKAAITGAGPTDWISNYGTGDIPRTKESEFLGPPWEAEANEVMVKHSPLTYVGNIKTPVLFVHGESDVRVPIAQAEELYTALKKRRVPAKFIRYPNSYHGNWAPWDTVHRYQQELAWWKEWLN